MAIQSRQWTVSETKSNIFVLSRYCRFITVDFPISESITQPNKTINTLEDDWGYQIIMYAI